MDLSFGVLSLLDYGLILCHAPSRIVEAGEIRKAVHLPVAWCEVLQTFSRMSHTIRSQGSRYRLPDEGYDVSVVIHVMGIDILNSHCRADCAKTHPETPEQGGTKHELSHERNRTDPQIVQ